MVKMVLVEDDEGVCNYIADFFSHRGHEVFVVSSVKQFLSIFEKHKPQILFLDLHGQKIDSVDLIERARVINKKLE